MVPGPAPGPGAAVSRRSDVAAPAAVAEETRGAGRGPAPRQRDPRHLPATVRADPGAGHAFRSLRAFRGAARGAREGLSGLRPERSPRQHAPGSEDALPLD